MSSGPVILLKITLQWSINLQNIWRRVVDRVLMNNYPSNIFEILLLLERYHQNCHVVFAATGMNGLNSLPAMVWSKRYHHHSQGSTLTKYFISPAGLLTCTSTSPGIFFAGPENWGHEICTMGQKFPHILTDNFFESMTSFCWFYLHHHYLG